MAFCPEYPNWDQNPKFTPLGKMTSILAPFIGETLPTRAVNSEKWTPEIVLECWKSQSGVLLVEI